MALFNRVAHGIYYVELGKVINMAEVFQRMIDIHASASFNREDDFVLIYLFPKHFSPKDSDYNHADFNKALREKAKNMRYPHVIYIDLGEWYRALLWWVHKMFPKMGENVYFVETYEEAISLAQTILNKKPLEKFGG